MIRKNRFLGGLEGFGLGLLSGGVLGWLSGFVIGGKDAYNSVGGGLAAFFLVTAGAAVGGIAGAVIGAITGHKFKYRFY